MGFLTDDRMHDFESGKRLFGFLQNAHPEVFPDAADNFEPIRTRINSVNDIEELWRCPVLWKTKKTKVEGSLWMQDPNQLSALYLGSTWKKWNMQRLTSLFKQISIFLDTHFAYLHLVADPEMDTAPYDQWYPLNVGVTVHHLKKGVVLLPWAATWGNTCVSMMDSNFDCKEFHRLEPLQGGLVYTQLTSDINDMATNLDQVTKVRQQILKSTNKQTIPKIDI